MLRAGVEQPREVSSGSIPPIVITFIEVLRVLLEWDASLISIRVAIGPRLPVWLQLLSTENARQFDKSQSDGVSVLRGSGGSG